MASATPEDGRLAMAISSWRHALGLGSTQADTGPNTLPEHLLLHSKALSNALAACGVSEVQRNAFQQVLLAAFELCSASHLTPDSLLSFPEAAFGSPGHGTLLFDVPRSPSQSSGQLMCTSDSGASDSRRKAGAFTGERDFQDDWESEGAAVQDSLAGGIWAHKDSMLIYERFGSWDLFSAAVSEMYMRLSRDPRTARFFQNKPHDRLMQHMTGFIASALLGRVMYKPADMRRAHCHMVEREGLGPEHVDIMCNHLKETLRNMGAAESTIQCAEGVLESQKFIFQKRDNGSHHHELADAASELTQLRVSSVPVACPFAGLGTPAGAAAPASATGAGSCPCAAGRAGLASPLASP